MNQQEILEALTSQPLVRVPSRIEVSVAPDVLIPAGLTVAVGTTVRIPANLVVQ